MTGSSSKRETFGHLAYVPKASLAVIVLQEWWGLNDQIRGVCNRLQQAGYSAFAPDLYKGTNTLNEEEANHLMEGLDWDGACDGDIAAAVDLLRKSHQKVAIMGFCMGGALAIAAGTRVKGIDGVVAYYGIPPGGIAAGEKLSAPFLGHFADKDGWITPASVNELEQQLQRAQTPHSIFRYDADHAFANETGPHHDPAAAELAWRRTVEFLKGL